MVTTQSVSTLVAILSETMQQQERQIQELSRENNELKNENARLVSEFHSERHRQSNAVAVVAQIWNPHTVPGSVSNRTDHESDAELESLSSSEFQSYYSAMAESIPAKVHGMVEESEEDNSDSHSDLISVELNSSDSLSSSEPCPPTKPSNHFIIPN